MSLRFARLFDATVRAGHGQESRCWWPAPAILAGSPPWRQHARPSGRPNADGTIGYAA